MATTTYGVNDALAVKLWSQRLDVEALPDTYFARFMGTTASSMIQIMPELSKGAGDRVRFALRRLATGAGTGETETQEGNEESLTKYYDEFVINELGHAHRVRSENTIDAQRVPYDLREECYESLKDWWADRMDTIVANHLAGNTAQTDTTHYGGHNAMTAPSTNRIIRAGGAASDQAMNNSSTHKFTLNLIDQAVNKAKNARPKLRPIRVNGKDHYVCFLHPDQVLALRSDASTAGNWFDLQKARLQGGEGDENGIFSGALGIYNNVILHEWDRIPKGVNGSTGAAVDNTRRAVFCGAQALGVAFGQKNTKTKFTWVEDMFDYDREFGVRASSIFGVKKTVYNSEDYGTIVIGSYAAPA